MSGRITEPGSGTASSTAQIEVESSESQDHTAGEAQMDAAAGNAADLAPHSDDPDAESADDEAAPKVEKEKVALSSLHRTLHSGEAAAQIDRQESDMPWLRKAMGFKDWVPNSRI